MPFDPEAWQDIVPSRRNNISWKDPIAPVASRRGWNVALILVLIIGLSWAFLYWALRPPDTAPPSDNDTASPDGGKPVGDDPYAPARDRMVSIQISARGVTDPEVLAAMRRVPRHQFVPAGQVAYAYEDRPLPIGYGQTISQPYIVAVMTESLNLEKGVSRALEVGTGSGYQAAVLSEICSEVYTVEIVEPLAETASATLASLGYSNVHVLKADGYYGWEEHAPYDVIMVTCAASHIPPALIDQLADGGRLILPLGSPHTWQTLTIVTKKDNQTTLRYLFTVLFVPMTGAIEQS